MKVINLNNTPPGSWKYLVPETAQWFPPNPREPFVAWNDFIPALERYYRVNNLTIPGDLSEKVQDQVCRNLPPGWCEFDNGVPFHGLAAPSTFSRIVQGTRILLDWALSGGRATNDEITSRAAICRTCPHNIDPVGCSSCSQGVLNDLVNLVAATSHPSDSFLRACAICGCLLKAKVRVPLDVLKRHITADQMKQFPDFCWLKQ